MAGGDDCQDQSAGGEIVPVELDADVLEIIDAYCLRFGLSDRGEAINELLMIGLNWSMTDRDRSEP
jgi:hypothetical protein